MQKLNNVGRCSADQKQEASEREPSSPSGSGGRAGGAECLAMVRFVSQPGKSHPPTPHGTGPHRFIFVQPK